MVLLENGQPGLRGDDDLSCVGLNFAREDFQKRRFSCAVGPNEAVAVPRGKFEVDFLEQEALAVGEGNISGGNHSRAY